MRFLGSKGVSFRGVRRVGCVGWVCGFLGFGAVESKGAVGVGFCGGLVESCKRSCRC